MLDGVKFRYSDVLKKRHFFGGVYVMNGSGVSN